MAAEWPFETERWWLHRTATRRLARLYARSLSATEASLGVFLSCCANVHDALYVRKTLAVRPSMYDVRYLLTTDVLAHESKDESVSGPAGEGE